MRSSNVLFSAVHLFVVFLILAVGCFFLVLPQTTQFRWKLIELLFHYPAIFMRIGIGMVGIGTLLFIGFFVLNKKRYLSFSMHTQEISIDENIAHDYVLSYWKEAFPDGDVASDVVVHSSNKVEVIAHIPKLTDEMLIKVEEELGAILERKMGYNGSFLLTLN